MPTAQAFLGDVPLIPNILPGTLSDVAGAEAGVVAARAEDEPVTAVPAVSAVNIARIVRKRLLETRST
jgi:hypothetical protein